MRSYFFMALAFFALPQLCQAGVITKTYGFGRITNNAAENVQSQLSVVVSGNSTTNMVSFTFMNNVGTASSITDIYFQDGSLLSLGTIVGSAGVSFAQYAAPGNLSGGNSLSPRFVTTAGFSLDSDSPVSRNGVNASSEWVTVNFTLKDSMTIVDTIAAMDRVISVGAGNIWRNNGNYLPNAAPGLRIGLRVQAIGTLSRSDSFVNVGGSSPPPPRQGDVPEPASAVVFLLLGAAGMVRHRFRESSVA